MNGATQKGQCFCGAVELSVAGAPEAMGYCHCGSCRSWSAGPVNAFTLWKPENVKVTKGQEHIATYHKTERSHRQFCRICGGHLMTAHPQWQLIDVYAATIPGFRFEPKIHVNYGERVLAIRDGLPKMKDLPKEMGGSGDMLLEALVACAGVTLGAVATALGIVLRDGKVTAEGDLDFRGTLGVSKEAPVGFRDIRLAFEIDSDADEEQLATLLRLTERYCVVYQTLRGAPPIATAMRRM